MARQAVNKPSCTSFIEIGFDLGIGAMLLFFFVTTVQELLPLFQTAAVQRPVEAYCGLKMTLFGQPRNETSQIVDNFYCCRQ
jgi:hypothetical protein